MPELFIFNNDIIDYFFREDDYFSHDVQRSTKPLKIKLYKATEFLDGPEYDVVQRYPMRSKPRGLVLIITNISYNEEPSRISAEHDESNLKELFEQMGFEVVTKRNLTGRVCIKDIAHITVINKICCNRYINVAFCSEYISL